MNYRKAAVGGTFDHFHAGHALLLKTAYTAAATVVVGVTHQRLTQSKTLSNIIEPYELRRQSLESHLRKYQQNQPTQIVQLTDACGPTLTDEAIDVLVVSEITQQGAELVNHHRQKRGLATLPVIVTPMVTDEIGNYISSTEIRSGRITRQGKVFTILFEQDIIFSPKQLEPLKNRQGAIFSKLELNPAATTVLVGDSVTQYFLQQQLPFSYAVIDGHTRRRPTKTPIHTLKKLSGVNPPGTISHHIARQLITGFDTDPKGTVYHIDGEEDLLAFVACLSLPLGSQVLYGQPGEGIVMISLSEAEKVRFAQCINPQFKP